MISHSPMIKLTVRRSASFTFIANVFLMLCGPPSAWHITAYRAIMPPALNDLPCTRTGTFCRLSWTADDDSVRLVGDRLSAGPIRRNLRLSHRRAVTSVFCWSVVQTKIAVSTWNARRRLGGSMSNNRYHSDGAAQNTNARRRQSCHGS